MKLEKGEYLTISEMAKRLGVTYLVARQRLLRAGIKPLSTESLYQAAALEAIRNVPGKGRPKKPPETERKPKAKKTKK